MPDYAHFHIDEAIPFCVTNVGPRPIRGTIMHMLEDGARTAWYYRGKNVPLHLAECETTGLAEELLSKHPGARRAELRDVNFLFEKLVCSWALVGPPTMALYIPTVHRKGPAFHDMRSWVKNNCVGDVCLMSSTYVRRISFATEDDYILGQMTFHKAF